MLSREVLRSQVVFTSTQTDAAQNFVTVLQDPSTYSATFPSLANTGSIEVSGITLTPEAAGTECAVFFR